MRPADYTDPTWQQFVRTLWSYQWLRKPSELTDAIYRKLFHCTQGVTEILVALFTYAQEVAIGEDEADVFGAITEELLQECYDSALVLLHPSLDALRSNDIRGLQLFDDLLPPGGISGAVRPDAPSAEETPQSHPLPDKPHEAPASEDDRNHIGNRADDGSDVRKPEGLDRALKRDGKIPGAPT